MIILILNTSISYVLNGTMPPEFDGILVLSDTIQFQFANNTMYTGNIRNGFLITCLIIIMYIVVEQGHIQKDYKGEARHFRVFQMYLCQFWPFRFPCLAGQSDIFQRPFSPF